jgi:uncharacterized membrane protein
VTVSGLVGGPWGRHAVGRTAWWWTPIRAVLVLTVLTSVFGFLAKSPCRTHPWSDEYQYTRLCYTDVYALYYAEGLDAGPGGSRVSVPYRDHPVEYPAVIGGLMWAAAEVTNAVHPDDPKTSFGSVTDNRPVTFFDVTALVLAMCAIGTAWFVARLAGRRRVWDAAMFAVAPALFLHEYTNWDMAAVVLAMAGMWAWSRRWRRPWVGPVLSGVFLGLGTATKLYPALILVALLFVCWRAARLRDWAICTGAAVGAFVLAYLPAILLSRSFAFPAASCPGARRVPAWEWFWRLNQIRGADWDSLWFQLQHLRGQPLDSTSCGQSPSHLNALVAVATIVVVALVALLVWLAPRRPRLAQVAFLLVAGFLLVNKVDSPQYVLWLLPLAVLARPRWRAFMVWQLAEAALLVARFYFFVGNDAATHAPPEGPWGLPIWVFFVSVGVRDLALATVMGLVVREVLRPEYDDVRADGVDDPAGGPVADAVDRWAAPVPA